MSIGAIWSACSPDFGVRSVVDRFAQIEPVVLLAVDGYSYGGKPYDRRAEVRSLQAALPSVRRTVVLRALDPDADLSGLENAVTWEEFEQPADGLAFNAGARRAPAVVVYRDDDAQAVVHSHDGMLIDQLRHRPSTWTPDPATGCSGSPRPGG